MRHPQPENPWVHSHSRFFWQKKNIMGGFVLVPRKKTQNTQPGHKGCKKPGLTMRGSQRRATDSPRHKEKGEMWWFFAQLRECSFIANVWLVFGFLDYISKTYKWLALKIHVICMLCFSCSAAGKSCFNILSLLSPNFWKTNLDALMDEWRKEKNSSAIDLLFEAFCHWSRISCVFNYGVFRETLVFSSKPPQMLCLPHHNISYWLSPLFGFLMDHSSWAPTNPTPSPSSPDTAEQEPKKRRSPSSQAELPDLPLRVAAKASLFDKQSFWGCLKR